MKKDEETENLWWGKRSVKRSGERVSEKEVKVRGKNEKPDKHIRMMKRW